MSTILTIAAHPDDIELSCGGTLAKLALEGHSVIVLDCTVGELGSRGTAELRKIEADNASKFLGIKERYFLNFGDGNVQPTKENIHTIVQYIRMIKPDILLIPPKFERHPDHEAVHLIARKAQFLSGVSKIETSHPITGEKQQVHRAKKMYSFMQMYDFEPDFYVDITSTFEQKTASILAYSSQFYNPAASANETGAETVISKPEFLHFLEDRAKYFGYKIGVKYAEAFQTIEPIGISSLSQLF
jgi:bacillithiol biosynthesis deacetylase BshB1